MAKFKIKELTLQLKITILSVLVILFTVSILLIFNAYKRNVAEKKQYLTQVYTKKNAQINNSQRILNSFIVFNHISYEKLDDFIDIQNTFFQTTDSINFYIKQYSELTITLEENQTLDEFNTEFQKFQNIIYEIFSEYKNDIINLQTIGRLFNKELISYQKVIRILNKLKAKNNVGFYASINSIDNIFKHLTIYIFVSFIVFITIFILLLFNFFKENITDTLNAQKYLAKLSEGNTISLPEKLNTNRDSIFTHISSINSIYDRINTHINELINQNYHLKINEGENDVITQSLSKLSSKLIESEQDIHKREEEDKQKEWANIGLNKFADLMRQFSDDLQKLSDEIIKNFVKYLEASVGGLFITQEEETDPHLKLLSAFAYDRKKYYTKRVNYGEGLIGTVAIDHSTIHISEIPQDYLEIESGLGDAPPNNLLIIPLLTDNGLLGVIEIASFKELKEFEIEFSENLAKTIASTLESVKVNAKTVELLKESQKQSDELANREKVLQQTMEEVSKAHEIARKNEIETRGILSGVDQTLMRAEYTPSGRFINSNMVHRRVMGYDIEKMKGKNILEFIQDEEKAAFKKMWDDVASGRPYQITVLRKNKQTGADVWLLNQYTPIKDDAGNVIKILYLAIDITEQKQAEEKANKLLKEAKEKEIELEGILTGVDRTILRAEYSADGIFLDSNDIHQNIFSYNKKDLIGTSIIDFVQEDEKEDFIKLWKQIKAGKHKELIVKRQNKQTNENIWLINQYNPILDDKNKVIKVLYLALDITEQKQAEEKATKLLQEATEQKIEMSGILSGIDQSLLRAEYTPDGNFITANDIHIQTLGYDFEKMKGKNILEFIVEEEKDDFLKIWNSVRRGGLEQLTVKRKNKETNEDIWLLNQYAPIADEKGDIVKVLYLAQDITEQKQIEEKANKLLREATEKEIEISGIISGIDQSLLRAEYSPEGNFIDANEIHVKTLGYDKEKMIGQNILEFIVEEEKKEFITLWNNVRNGKLEQLTVKRKNKHTGEDIWLLNQYAPIADEKGKIIKILYLAQDITEQKHAEEQAKELLKQASEKEIEITGIISAIDQTLLRAEYSPEGNFIDANDIHVQTLGYDKEKMIGQNILEFVNEDNKNEFNDVWANVQKGIPSQITVKKENKNTGEVIWLLNYFTPILDNQGNITKILFLGQDITEQKQAEEMAAELLLDAQKQEFELGTIINAIDQTLLRARYTKDGVFIDSNEIHREVLGYDIENMYGKNILEFIPENEKEEFTTIWNDVAEGNSKQLIVRRFNKKTGDDIWLQNEYTPIRNMENEVSEILYLGIDITEQKKLEEQTAKLLEQSQKNEKEISGLLSGVDQTLLRAEYTADGTFISANKNHSEVLGYDYKTMIGKNILEFIAEEEKENFTKMWNSVKAGEAKNITVKRKNKETDEDIWLLNQYTPIKNEQGITEKILYLASDITEQKKLEAELTVQEQIMNQNMEELFKEFSALEEQNEELENFKKDIEEKFDTDDDKLYNNWLNNFD